MIKIFQILLLTLILSGIYIAFENAKFLQNDVALFFGLTTSLYILSTIIERIMSLDNSKYLSSTLDKLLDLIKDYLNSKNN